MQKKDIIELSVTCVLVLVFLVVGINGVKRIRQGRSLKIKPQRAISKKSKSVNIGPSGRRILFRRTAGRDQRTFQRLEEETKNLKLRRDPFVAGSTVAVEETPISGLSLTGIIWDRDNPLAIINDSIVRVGDNLGISKVIDIKQGKVVLNDGINDLELNLD